MTRVVWVVDALKLGGAERLAVAFARQAPAGVQATLVALQPPPGSATALPAPPRSHTLAMRALHDWRQWLRFERLLKDLRPALIHSHLRYATIWSAAAARRLRIAHVATVHELPRPAASRREAWVLACERWALAQAARTVFVSAAQAAAWGPPPGWRSCVLANGTPPLAPLPAGERAARRRGLGIPADACLFATVAVVRARKGWREWLAAADAVASLCPRAWFLWVGGGPEFAALDRAVAAALHTARIGVTGPRGDVAELLRLADVFVLPSHEEALPTAVMEAMAAQLPVIASDLPGVREVMGDTGVLVPAGDARALAAAMVALEGEHGAGARLRHAAAGRRRFDERFTEAQWMRRLLGLYAELVPTAGRRTGQAA